MATINGSTSSNLWTYKLEAYELSDSINIVNNTSTVRVDMYLGRASSQSYIGTNWTGSITVNGQTQSLSGNIPYPTYINGGAWLYLGTKDFSVEHTSDGSKITGVSGSWASEPGVTPSSASASGELTLTTIPRASSISSVTTANIGSVATITVDRKSNSFTHTITYLFGSETGTIVTKSSDVSIPWTIPTSFYQQGQMPNEKTGYGTLTITTYNGDTQIGNSTTKTFYVSTDENECKPTVDNISIIEGDQDIANITGSTSSNVILVKGYSTATVGYSATPKNSASIKTVTTNNETAYSGTSSSTVTGTKPLTNFNADKIDIVATDSRTYSDTKTLTAGTDYTLIPYIPLTFNGEVTRQAPTSDTLLLSFSGNYFYGSLGDTTNSLSLVWKWREKGASTWEPGGTLVLNTDYTIDTTNNVYTSGSGSTQTAISLGNSFDYRKNFEIQVQYTDALVDEPSSIMIGVKGIPIVNWGDDYFNVNGDIKQNGNSIFSVDFCKMITNDYETFTQSSSTVSVWGSGLEYGDYEYDTINNYLIITNTTLCEISGAFGGGGGSAWATIRINDGTSDVQSVPTLVQPSGNLYFFAPIPTAIIELDPTKTYYVYLVCSSYNVSSFTLNAGFSTASTWISAKKIK